MVKLAQLLTAQTLISVFLNVLMLLAEIIARDARTAQLAVHTHNAEHL